MLFDTVVRLIGVLLEQLEPHERKGALDAAEKRRIDAATDAALAARRALDEG